MLPVEKFIPVNEREAQHDRPPALFQIPDRATRFERLLDQMQLRLHQGHSDRLKILQMCHKFK